MNEEYVIKKIDIVDSTNVYLEKYVYDNANNKKDILLIANQQTNGKGRFDRKFYSPKGAGLYVSLLHYYKNILEIEDITLKVGFAILTVLKNQYNKNVKIKLINDIYYNEKKVIGILCKHIIKLNAVIIGIGIDLYKNDNVPEDLKNIIGYLFEEKINEEIFLKNIFVEIYKIFNKE